MDDAAVLDSFVYQVMVTPEECVATLYCDDERNEPARLSIARVRTFSGWCPVSKDSRTQVLALGRSVFIRFSRAA